MSYENDLNRFCGQRKLFATKIYGFSHRRNIIGASIIDLDSGHVESYCFFSHFYVCGWRLNFSKISSHQILNLCKIFHLFTAFNISLIFSESVIKTTREQSQTKNN